MYFSIETEWDKILADELSKPYMQELAEFLILERGRKDLPIFPSEGDVFKAFLKTPFQNVKVVIVGQDPYHGPNQAEGLSFSVPNGLPIPPSLRNIFLELCNDLKMNFPKSGNLDAWASQGVLLLNSVLTVRQGEPNSHMNRGWERFTDEVLKRLALRDAPPIFVLWGKNAQKKMAFLANRPGIHCLTAMHPSPLSASRGFFGCRHFSKINDLLQRQGKTPIDWRLDA